MAIELSNFAKVELDKVLEAVRKNATDRNLPEELTSEGILENQRECNQRMMSIVNAIDVALKTLPAGNGIEWERETLYRLMSLRPLTPLTGEDDEWMEVRDVTPENMTHLAFGVTPEVLEVNMRDFAVFRINRDNAYAYDSNARMFTADEGHSFHRSWRSAAKITFPYMGPTVPDIYLEDAPLDDCAFLAPDELLKRDENASVEYEEVGDMPETEEATEE